MSECGELIGLAQAARLLGATGRMGRPVHPATLSRWIAKGVAVGAGRVRLKAVRVGHKLATTPAWVAEFVDATTRAAEEAGAADAPRTPAERERAAAAAAVELDAMGC